MGDRPLVIGVGNTMRGDDGVGPAVVEALGERNGVDLVVSDGDLGELIDLWRSASTVVIVDAMTSGRPAGEVEVVDASDTPLPAGMRLGSSHHLGVAEAVELARVLGRLPRRVVVVGVEASAFATGGELTPEVRRAVATAVTAVEEELDGA